MKFPKLNQKGITHILAPLAFVFIFAAVGGYILTRSHAAAKYINLQGIISKSGGSFVANATVTLKHPGGGASYDYTDAAGDYGFTYLLVGKTYTVSAQKKISGTLYCGAKKNFVVKDNGKAAIKVNLTLTHAAC